jgi:hypothetical protein
VPGPLCIHTDKSKTKAKEAEEREKQRWDEMPTNHTVSDHFTRGMEMSPEILMVANTYSGSMTHRRFSIFLHTTSSNLSKRAHSVSTQMSQRPKPRKPKKEKNKYGCG